MPGAGKKLEQDAAMLEAEIAAEKSAVKAKLDEAVEAWFVETFHNLGLDTSLYNRFYAAKDGLKVRLQTALKED